MSKAPMLAGTMQTDPRGGGLKRSSGVNVKPEVAAAWAEVRDNGNTAVDWILVGYENGSKTDLTILAKGNGGLEAASAAMPTDQPTFGGCRLSTGRFVGFTFVPEDIPAMQKGRASMHKNGVLNVMEGRDGEIGNMRPGLKESEISSIK